jgi:hypothetical protein
MRVKALYTQKFKTKLQSVMQKLQIKVKPDDLGRLASPIML